MAMNKQDSLGSVDRRFVLARAAALTLVAASGSVLAQPGGGQAMPDKELRQKLAEFVVGFDLKNVPAHVVERARVAFIDSIGVAVAGSHEEVAHVVAEMVNAEGSAS